MPTLNVLLILFVSATTAGMGGAPSYLMVRYDDYSPRAPVREHAVGIELERHLFESFRNNNARLVVGVVPYPTAHGASTASIRQYSEGFVDWLERPDEPWLGLLRRYVGLGVVEVALHGHSHVDHTPPGHRPGEFAGVPYDRQYESIRAGRDALTTALGVSPRSFVPPWNSWDANTSRALGELGFEWCSADLMHSDSMSATVRHVPQCSWEPRDVLELLRSNQEVPPASIVVLVTHPADFQGERGEEYFRSLQELLKFVKGDARWESVGLSDLPEATLPEWQRRFRKAVAWEHTQRLLRDCWGSSMLFPGQPVIYKTADWYDSHLPLRRLAIAAVLLTSAALGWLGAQVVSRRALRSRRLVLTACALALAALVLLVLGAADIAQRGYGIRGLRWQAIAVVTGSTLAFGGVALKGRRRDPGREPRRDLVEGPPGRASRANIGHGSRKG